MDCHRPLGKIPGKHIKAYRCLSCGLVHSRGKWFTRKKERNESPPLGSLVPYGISTLSPKPSKELQGVKIDARQGIAHALQEKRFLDSLNKWSDCGRKAFAYQCRECGEFFYVPYRCDLRICPRCAWRYARDFEMRYVPIIKRCMRYQKAKNRPGLLTLTTRNTGLMPTNEELKRHNEAVRKLIQWPWYSGPETSYRIEPWLPGSKWAKKKGKPSFKGAVIANEVKETNLHSHAITVGPYRERKQLCEIWEYLTGNTYVHIEQIRGDAKKVSRYVSKYLRKPFSYEKNEAGYSLAVDFLGMVKGRRRVHSFGVFYGQKKRDPAETEFLCAYCHTPNPVCLANCIYWYDFTIPETVEECEKMGWQSYSQIRKARALAEREREAVQELQKLVLEFEQIASEPINTMEYSNA